MNKGLLLSVLNEKPVNASTRRIEVRIKAEPGFRPQTDVDVASLRFGSYTEVNFGRGCKALKTRRDGDDLIVVFDGKGSGITPEEFAPKMIGRTRDGSLLYGYARLPYVDYRPALLSACRPQYDEEKHRLSLKVENFGLSPSRPSTVEVRMGNAVLAQGEIPVLTPYGAVELQLPLAAPVTVEAPSFEVVVRTDGAEVERVTF